MAKMLVFDKYNEDELLAYYKVESDSFDAELIIDKIYQNIELIFTSTSKYLNNSEITKIKKEYVEWVINKRTNNLTIFLDTFSFNS